MNEYDTNKKIDNDLIRRYNYVIKRRDAIKFKKPPETSYNKWLFNIEQPVNFKIPDHYYIDKVEHDKLFDLFESFKIPNNVRPNLVFAYLSMVFASSTALFNDDFSKKNKETQSELFALLDLIEGIVTGKKHLSSVSFEIKGSKETSTPPQDLVIKKSDSFFGSKGLEFIVDVLSHYKQSSYYENVLKWKEINGIAEKRNNLNRHKNKLKYNQSYYAWNIFDLIKKELSEPLNKLRFKFYETKKDSDKNKYLQESQRLKTTYPNTKLYLLIGKMMLLSKFMDNKDKEFENYKKITDTIKKKIAPYLKKTNK